MILRFISAITFLFLPLWIGIATLGIYMILEKIKEFKDEIQSYEQTVQKNKRSHSMHDEAAKSVSERHRLPDRARAKCNI